MVWKARSAHRWMAILVGLFMFLWLLSGILMVLPQFPDKPRQVKAPPTFDWQKATISIADAVSILGKHLQRPVTAKKIELVSLLNSGFYRVYLTKGKPFLINSLSGEIEEITPEKAEIVLRQYFPSTISIKEKQRLDENSIDYLWGPLPVMRFILSDPPGTIAYISLRDGAVRWSSRWTSIRGAIESFHTFDTMKLITTRKEISRLALIILSLIGLGVVLTGAVLAFQPFRRG